MSVRTRLAVTVIAAATGAAALSLPISAATSAQKLPIQVGVTQRGEVCYSANSDGSNVHCTDPILR